VRSRKPRFWRNSRISRDQDINFFFLLFGLSLTIVPSKTMDNMDDSQRITLDTVSEAKPKRISKPTQREFPAPKSGAAKRTAASTGRSGSKKGKRQSKPPRTDVTQASISTHSFEDSMGDDDLEEEGEEYSHDEDNQLDQEGETPAENDTTYGEMPQNTQHKPPGLVMSDRSDGYGVDGFPTTTSSEFTSFNHDHDTGAVETRADTHAQIRSSTRVSKPTLHFVTENSQNHADGVIGRYQMSQGAPAKRHRDVDLTQDSEDESGSDQSRDCVREPENIFPSGQHQTHHPPHVFTCVYVPRVIAGTLPPKIPGMAPPHLWTPSANDFVGNIIVVSMKHVARNTTTSARPCWLRCTNPSKERAARRPTGLSCNGAPTHGHEMSG
jgi:hypothetical protein